MKKEITPTLKNTPHLGVKMQGSSCEKQEAYFYFDSEWRGQAVEFCYVTSRYQLHGGDMSDWRGYVVTAYYLGDDGKKSFEKALSDTAKARLRSSVESFVSEWIETNTETEEPRAVLNCLVNLAGERYALAQWDSIRTAWASRFSREQGEALDSIRTAWTATLEATKAASKLL